MDDFRSPFVPMVLLPLSTPAGIILNWSGAIVDIPAGWALCDGNNGTPDLRDTFIIPAGSTYVPGDSGGNAQHSHSYSDGGHSHNAIGPTGIAIGSPVATVTNVKQDIGTTDNASSLPKYYSLAFIMKL